MHEWRGRMMKDREVSATLPVGDLLSLHCPQFNSSHSVPGWQPSLIT